MLMPTIPFPNSYWVRPGQILAGEHPALLDPAGNRERMRRILALGIAACIDLTEPDETADLEPYLPIAQQILGAGRTLGYCRIAIPDMGVPTPAEMQRALDTIDQAISAGGALYIHCWGGIGRTGTVVGCYLVRGGMGGDAAIREIARLRRGTPDERYPAPARDIQRQMVLGWKRGL